MSNIDKERYHRLVSELGLPVPHSLHQSDLDDATHRSTSTPVRPIRGNAETRKAGTAKARTLRDERRAAVPLSTGAVVTSITVVGWHLITRRFQFAGHGELPKTAHLEVAVNLYLSLDGEWAFELHSAWAPPFFTEPLEYRSYGSVHSRWDDFSLALRSVMRLECTQNRVAADARCDQLLADLAPYQFNG